MVSSSHCSDKNVVFFHTLIVVGGERGKAKRKSELTEESCYQRPLGCVSLYANVKKRWVNADLSSGRCTEDEEREGKEKENR